MYLLGIDLGTSAVKVLLCDESGKILDSASESYPLDFPREGWSEQQPQDWWTGVKKALHQLGRSYDLKQVKALSFGGQMHGLVALDEMGEVIRPAILWNDGRTGDEVQYLNEEIGRDKLIAETGNIAYAGFTAPKIIWLRKHEPESFARLHKVLLPKDYLAYLFTGNFVTDYSDASGMLLLDVRNKRWSAYMLELCGLTVEQMPELHESFDAVGTVLPERAEELGLSPECIVAAGAGDNAAAAIGTGTMGDDACNLSLGTSGTIFITSHNFVPIPNSELHSFAHADGRYHVMGCMLSAASCNKWWVEEILRSHDYAGEEKGIEALGENRVFFMPYLMGERSPHNDETIRAAFIGLTLSTPRHEMEQAILEGVAFGLRDCLEVARAQGIEVRSSMVSGGGAKSALWKKILANVLNLRIQEAETQEGPALGAALLAAVAAGTFENVEAARDAVIRVKSTIEPEPELVVKYDRAYQRFHKLYPALRDFYR